jgi:hypothetical protein
MMAKQMIQRFTFGCLALLLPLANVQAQMGGGDPAEEIKEIARAIDKQLKEIDKLLLQSGRKGQTRKKPMELLKQAAESSLTVQDGIEKLIEKLNEMKQQGGGGGQPSEQPQDDQQGSQSEQQQSGQQSGQQSQGNQQRRENQTPDFVQQPQEGQSPGEQGKPGQQQGQKPDQMPGSENGPPKGGSESKDGGQNKLGNNPPNSPTGPGQPGTGDGGWGNLQPYLNFLRNRGASPKVPEKYRKYYEAYLKNKVKGRKK